MKPLQNLLVTLRSARRRAASRLVRTDPSQVAPARLVLRLDDGDLPGALRGTERASLAQWQAHLVEAIQWLGVTPVSVRTGPLGGTMLTSEVLRFAHRLDCPTLLVCDGEGIDMDAALRLIDAGLGAVRLEVDAAQGPAEAAARALIAARRARGVSLDVEVVLLWQGRAAAEGEAVLGWARDTGCDGFRISPPWRAAGLPMDPELLDRLVAESGALGRSLRGMLSELHAMAASQDGEPGMGRRRRGRRCPVGGQRLVLAATGEAWCCPFKAPLPLGEGLEEGWARAGGHLSEIASCGRACAHVELAPEPVVR